MVVGEFQDILDKIRTVAGLKGWWPQGQLRRPGRSREPPSSTGARGLLGAAAPSPLAAHALPAGRQGRDTRRVGEDRGWRRRVSPTSPVCL